ncbi:hypothetical protein PDIDSM_1508 [Penicillium digitatum]|nr:hypothetical protein PDIDSM_1508 [Penicillium digitatum]
MAPLRLKVEGQSFRDPHNREITLRGINVAADAKYPKTPDTPTYIAEKFFDADNISFVGRPFPLEDAHVHFKRLRKWGYNTIRYIFTWEAIEHAGPGIYDHEWIEFTIKVLRIAKQYDFWVFMDPHQDVWSRFSGGSGAPMWTLYAAGLNPKTFKKTEAALVQNTYDIPAEFPKMIWSTNYTRLVCQTMFTLFWAGRDFAPKAVIDGLNIQDYLQNHFIDACAFLAQRIHEVGDLDGEVIIGWESMNEPHRGIIGVQDISVIPPEQQLQLGTSPTAFQAMLTGSGKACEQTTWAFGNFGPYKTGTNLVDPAGEIAWLPADHDDTKYGWQRDPGWRLGECIWAQHGVWDPSTDTLLQRGYFSKNPQTGEPLDYEKFTNSYFLDHYRAYKNAIRGIWSDAIMFCQPPVMEIPPDVKGTADDDPNMVHAVHFYDGLTLLTKHWNRLYNVDVIGVLRGKYLTPAFALKVGETAIRNCLRDQLKFLRDESRKYMGSHPVNNHEWGDQWNGEDLSIYSRDDLELPAGSTTRPPDPHSPAYSESQSSGAEPNVGPRNLKGALSTPSISSDRSQPSLREQQGYRAAEAYLRPSPTYVSGKLDSHVFDLKNCAFTLSLTAKGATTATAPTEIYLPEFHFPESNIVVAVSGGKWDIDVQDVQGVRIQRLRWWHAEGEQDIKIEGIKRKPGEFASPGGADTSYLGQCQNGQCVMM